MFYTMGLQPRGHSGYIVRPLATVVNNVYTIKITQYFRVVGAWGGVVVKALRY